MMVVVTLAMTQETWVTKLEKEQPNYGITYGTRIPEQFFLFSSSQLL
jgi:hypothetical protein